MILEGPAGIGKSRLLDAAAERAAGGGATVLRARGSELESELSFGGVLQLFAASVLEASADERDALFDGAAGLARPLFERATATEGGGDRSLPLLHGLYWLVAQLADRSPLLIAADDAQWLDNPSLRFLHYLLQRSAELPVAVLVAIRSGEPAAEADLIRQLPAIPGATVLKPAALSPAAVGRRVREDLPEASDEFCSACAEATAGNPFYLRALLAAVGADGIAPTAEAAARVAAFHPDAVVRALPLRLSRLAPEAAAIARAAAVLGDRATFPRAATLAGVSPQDAAPALDALGAADVIAGSEPLAFVHPVVRASIHADISPRARSAMHAQAALLLLDEGADPEAVASHLLATAPRGDEWVSGVLREAAARAAGNGAFSAAGRYLERALAEQQPDEQRGELLVELGMVEAAAGTGRPLERLGEGVGLIADPSRRAPALFDLAVVTAHAGRYDEAAEAAGGGLEQLDAGDPAELRADLEALAVISANYGLLMADREASRERLEGLLGRANLEATPAGRALLAHAALAEGYEARDRARQVALARRALSLGEPTEHPFDPIVFGLAGLALVLADELEEAERSTSAAVAATSRRGSILDVAPPIHIRSIARLEMGRIADAISDTEVAIEAGRQGWGATLPMVHAVMIDAQLEQGDLEAAEAARELPGGEEMWHVNPSWGVFLVSRGRLRAARGDDEGALEDLLQAGRLADFAGARNPLLVQWRREAVPVLARLGDMGRAREIGGEALEAARGHGAPRGVAVCLRALAAAAPGEPERIELLEEAERVLEGSPARLVRAHVLVDLGAAIRRAGRRRDSRDPLQRGLDLAHRCGASALVDRALEELRASGARPRRPALRGAGALTPSEGRVAALARDGMTNREIAQSLFVTRRTVEMHLSNAYGKLDIGSREELPEALAE